MLRRLRVQGFKSLVDVDVGFPRFTVLFGPNAVGKSNMLDAVVLLSRLASSRTLADAIAAPIRGYPLEQFTLPNGGLTELLSRDSASLQLEADLELREGDEFRYRVSVRVEPRSGALSVADEYLARLSKAGEPKGSPQIEVVGKEIRIRRKSKPAHPRTEPLYLGHTQLSDSRFSGVEYLWIERSRRELSDFRTYYLDPRVAMRRAVPPKEASDIGALGEDLAPYLYRLRTINPKSFAAVLRTLRSIVPSVDSLDVDLDEKRGTLDIQIIQEDRVFSSRVISEGTLRVLALCAIACNPSPGALVAFEEPENGVHPRRLELVARLLTSLAVEQERQVIVTTHSPIFCQEVLDLKREHDGLIELMVVRQVEGETRCVPFDATGPLFDDAEIRAALTTPSEDGWFAGLVARGLVDA